MIIKRIKARNFKTYLHLDLDISVDPEKPIILIGGANGGGKTTLFEAIYGALYGLKVPTSKIFHELLNAGALDHEEKKIELELHFSGMVLNQEQQYVLTRTYMLNPSNHTVESVRLNMDGNIFMYGTATPPAQRAEQEAQVNKIIKANLPQELSRYFLFDAMEAGNLLKEDQLNRVIKENIENVMGFNKYLQMARASETLTQTMTAQRLQVQKEKDEYLELVEHKKFFVKQLEQNEQQLQDALQYSVANKDLYDELKNGLNQEATIKNKLAQAKTQIDGIYKKEALYRSDLDNFNKEIELSIVLPKMLESIRSEITLILKAKAEKEQHESSSLNPEQIKTIGDRILQYLKEQGIPLDNITVNELTDYVIAASKPKDILDEYAFLDFSEVKALEKLVNHRAINIYPALHQSQNELNLEIQQLPGLEAQLEAMRAQISGRDYSVLKAYEENEQKIKELEQKTGEIKTDIQKLEKKLHKFDPQIGTEPDPRYDTLLRLKPFFENVANDLLKVKKQQIEIKMKEDLNINLAAYRDVIDRVELSEDLKDLTFKIFHHSGNEIYLNQLNTASKQVVIQVLLKALHEFGDYNPPVMIDTVMGVLDETSRSTLLENYFPELSHQTILLSSDSEIRTGKDLQKIEPFISKAYTLQRNRDNQSTEITSGYFGITLND